LFGIVIVLRLIGNLDVVFVWLLLMFVWLPLYVCLFLVVGVLTISVLCFYAVRCLYTCLFAWFLVIVLLGIGWVFDVFMVWFIVVLIGYVFDTLGCCLFLFIIGF